MLLDGEDVPVLAGQPAGGGQQHVAQHGPAAELQKEVKSVTWKFAGMASTEQSRSEANERLSRLMAAPMELGSADPGEIGQAVEAHWMAGDGQMITVSSPH